MSDRSWYCASGGQQQGPYPEAQLREFIARGNVTADTLVWTEGMTNWQRVGEIPGLFSGSAAPPAIPRAGAPLPSGSIAGGQPLSASFGVWALLGRVLLLMIGTLVVIPAPWVATAWYRWFAEHISVPRRPNLGFAGQPGDIWYVFIILALAGYVGLTGVAALHFLMLPVQGFLGWMIIRWVVANLSSDGRTLSLTFSGNPGLYIGWHLLAFLAIFTIIGWAWVATAWMRWICQHIEGTRREVVYQASGLQLLWRTLVFVLACCSIIAIPWALAWYARWSISQFALVQRTA
jgi:hypothetical protein